jgi:hypothetical protein
MRSVFEVKNIGDLSILLTLWNNNSNPLYFVCHKTESVVRKIEISKRALLYPLVHPKNTAIVIEPKDNANLEAGQVAFKFEYLVKKDYYLYLMLGINDDFDDDFLFDTIDLLDNCQ